MPSERIEFGQFVLDITGYELTCAGKTVRLERIPMDLLILLAQQKGRMVSRDEIIERLWGKQIFLDTDNGINSAIRKIRRALGEDPETPRFIETISGKGYRFRGGKEAGRPTSFAANTPMVPEVMLAVLPFENLSGDPDQEYFSDGLTEETIMQLGQISPHRLGVIARTSAMTYKKTAKTIFQIGEELHVDYVVEGSVRREGENARVTAQLIRVSDQIHLWAHNYDRKLSNLIEIQGEVGAAIASQVKLQLTPDEQHKLKTAKQPDETAYDHYLRGLYHHARVTFPELRKAMDHFQQATQRDPGFAPAYAGLADCYVILPITSDFAPRDALAKARAAVTQALTIDPNSAQAHTADATIKFWFDWEWDGAIAGFQHAIGLTSNYARAHQMLAHTFSNTGQHAHALRSIQQARRLDPFSLITNTMHGQFLYHAGQDQEAIRQLNATLDMEPRFW